MITHTVPVARSHTERADPSQARPSGRPRSPRSRHDPYAPGLRSRKVLTYLRPSPVPRYGNGDLGPGPGAHPASPVGRRVPQPTPRRGHPTIAHCLGAPRLSQAAFGDRTAHPASRRGRPLLVQRRCCPAGPAGDRGESPPAPLHRRHEVQRDQGLAQVDLVPAPSRDRLRQPGRDTRHQRPASGHGPRMSSRAALTSSAVTEEGRRRVLSSHSSTEGRDAKRVASLRNNSGTDTPSSAALRDRAAYTSSSRSLICTVFDIVAS